MPPRKKLYVDSEGVKRGYYVYLHKDRVTGAVFYVGKGSGKRAWEANARSDEWMKQVASLANGWRVQVVKDDLSELEAFALEAELVEKHGGCAANGGTLTNWLPGGEDPASVGLAIQLDDRGWSEAYCNARKFTEFTRGKEERFVRDLKKELDCVLRSLDVIQEAADDGDDEAVLDSVAGLECIVGGLRDVCSNFLRHRVSWKELALALEEASDDLEAESEDPAEQHKEVIPFLKQSSELAGEFLRRIDTGNRKEAENAATQITGRE